jgi:membrane protease YdiL (CAAX protease family)
VGVKLGDESMIQGRGTEEVQHDFSKAITKTAYISGLLIILGSAYAQYLFGSLGPAAGMFVVYGIPILAVSWLWRTAITRKALKNTRAAVKFGLGFFGAFTILGLVAATAIFLVLVSLDPAALNLLDRPNPVLNISREYAWIMVWVSVLIVGPAEEYLFRGFVFGGLLSLLKNRHWLALSFLSSVLFAAAHLYYAVVYGVASAVQFADLVTFGMAMAATYYLSGGNLLVPAVIHGVYDAIGFLGVAMSPGVGATLRGLMILIGLVVALALFIRSLRRRRTPHGEPLANRVSVRSSEVASKFVILSCDRSPSCSPSFPVDQSLPYPNTR